MGRTAHCPSRKRSLASFPLGDANRGVFGRFAGSNRESPPHRPPERRAFPFSGDESRDRDCPASYNLNRPVRTTDKLSTVRVLGRAAAGAALLRVILRRGSSRETPRDFT